MSKPSLFDPLKDYEKFDPAIAGNLADAEKRKEESIIKEKAIKTAGSKKSDGGKKSKGDDSPNTHKDDMTYIETKLTSFYEPDAKTASVRAIRVQTLLEKIIKDTNFNDYAVIDLRCDEDFYLQQDGSQDPTPDDHQKRDDGYSHCIKGAVHFPITEHRCDTSDKYFNFLDLSPGDNATETEIKRAKDTWTAIANSSDPRLKALQATRDKTYIFAHCEHSEHRTPVFTTGYHKWFSPDPSKQIVAIIEGGWTGVMQYAEEQPNFKESLDSNAQLQRWDEGKTTKPFLRGDILVNE